MRFQQFRIYKLWGNGPYWTETWGAGHYFYYPSLSAVSRRPFMAVVAEKKLLDELQCVLLHFIKNICDHVLQNSRAQHFYTGA